MHINKKPLSYDKKTTDKSYGGDFLYSQPEDILKLYDLEVSQITKGRGFYICSTNQGRKMLLPFNGSKEKGIYLKEFLDFLRENNWDVQQILPTANEEIVAEDELGTRYILKDMYEGSEISTRNLEEVCDAMELLGQYHEVVKKCPLEIPDCMKNARRSLWEQYEKHKRELNKVYHYVKARKKKNDFEQQFTIQYPMLSGNLDEILKKMEEIQGREQISVICHGDYNQHNILTTKQGLRMVNFEGLEYNIPIVDVAHFMRKILEKNGWREEVGIAMLESYEKSRKFPAQEKEYLYLMLKFPEKLWKLANHYYNSHKAWMSGRDLEKLKKIAAQEEMRQQFLEKMFSFFQ